MPDPAATNPSEQYAAIEQAYSAQHWSTVLQQGRDLMRELALDGGPNAQALRQRLELMLGHTQLYGFGDVGAAEDHYRALLSQRTEDALRQMAEQGLQQCREQAGRVAAAEPQAAADPRTVAAGAGASPAGEATVQPAGAADQPAAGPAISLVKSDAQAQAASQSGREAGPALDPASERDQPGSPPSPQTSAAVGEAAAAAPWLADLNVQSPASQASPYAVKDPFLTVAAAAAAAVAAAEAKPGPAANAIATPPSTSGPAAAQASAAAPAEAPASDDAQAAATTSAAAESLTTTEEPSSGTPAGPVSAGLHLERPGAGEAEPRPASPHGQASGDEPTSGLSTGPRPVEADELLIPEVVDEPELFEVHRADPSLAEDIDVPLSPSTPDHALDELVAAAAAAAQRSPQLEISPSGPADDPVDDAADADLLACLRMVTLS